MGLFGKRKHSDHSDDGFEQHDENISFRRVPGTTADLYVPQVHSLRMEQYSASEALEALRELYPNASDAALQQAVQKVYK